MRISAHQAVPLWAGVQDREFFSEIQKAVCEGVLEQRWSKNVLAAEFPNALRSGGLIMKVLL
jgi:hypothetical protein